MLAHAESLYTVQFTEQERVDIEDEVAKLRNSSALPETSVLTKLAKLLTAV